MAQGRHYERIGDPFTRLVLSGKGPPTIIYRYKQSTGRHYCIRVPVDCCAALRVAQVMDSLQNIRAGQPKMQNVPLSNLVQFLVVDWWPEADRVKLKRRDRPHEAKVRVGLQVTHTGPGGYGARLWLSCPRCSRRCRVVYVSPWNARGAWVPGQPVTGCRQCLGLTDESRQRHKTIGWADAVLGEQPYGPAPTLRYSPRGGKSVERAQAVITAKFGERFTAHNVVKPAEDWLGCE